MSNEIKITYTLEMRCPEELRPKYIDCPELRIEKVEIKIPEYNKFLHTMVGYEYRWGGRNNWDRNDWNWYVNRDELETWVAYISATPIGYFELEKGTESDIHIQAFGLLPNFIGKGFGGYLLTKAVEIAWDMQAKRIWVNTCSHDHPHALQNYLARGFKIIKVTEEPANKPIKSFWELMEQTC